MSYYAPPDTGVPNLRLVTVEHLPSIEGADRICRSAPFCGEIIFICSALGRGGALLRPRVLILSEARAEQSPAPTERTPKAPLAGADSPYQGEMSRRDKRGRDAGSAQPRLRGCRRFATADASGGPIFSLAREKIGEKRVLGCVWCFLPLISGESQCFRRRSTR